jgi:probable LLM family oxidoreductase
MSGMEFGVFSFAEHMPDPLTGERISAAQRLHELVEQAELADRLGLDVFGVGEHHRPDLIAPAPAVVLAAIAARTERIRLTSAVSVISTDDPVRVFEEFATLDLLSGGRAEIMAGRGSFTESFPLFGYDLADYDALFDEKLRLLLQLREEEIVSWSGAHRAPLDGMGVYPRPQQDPLPVWVAVGGAPESAFRAGTLGLPLALAIIGGMPERFVPFADLHRDAARQAGFDPVPALSINSHGYLAETYERAVEESFPYVASMMNRIGLERGWQPMTRDQYEAGATLRGAYVVGTPAQAVEKILFQHDLFGHDRFALQFSIGPVPHDRVLRCIELYATEVVPAVRSELEERASAIG